MLPLGSPRCRCCTCGLYFAAPSTFDRHRAGRISVDRHCLTEAELREAGFMLMPSGHWGRPRKYPAVAVAADAGADFIVNPSQGSGSVEIAAGAA